LPCELLHATGPEVHAPMCVACLGCECCLGVVAWTRDAMLHLHGSRSLVCVNAHAQHAHVCLFVVCELCCHIYLGPSAWIFAHKLRRLWTESCLALCVLPQPPRHMPRMQCEFEMLLRIV
jgi:hypothetical protein